MHSNPATSKTYLLPTRAQKTLAGAHVFSLRVTRQAFTPKANPHGMHCSGNLHNEPQQQKTFSAGLKFRKNNVPRRTSSDTDRRTARIRNVLPSTRRRFSPSGADIKYHTSLFRTTPLTHSWRLKTSSKALLVSHRSTAYVHHVEPNVPRPSAAQRQRREDPGLCQNFHQQAEKTKRTKAGIDTTLGELRELKRVVQCTVGVNPQRPRGKKTTRRSVNRGERSASGTPAH